MLSQLLSVIPHAVLEIVWIAKVEIDGGKKKNLKFPTVTELKHCTHCIKKTLCCGALNSIPLLPWLFSSTFCIQILVHVGFLTEESGDVFSPKVLKGGPLGEMVQWADILTALHVLGHNLKISFSLKELHG